LEPAEECVTTHLPKRSAPKMDGAQVSGDSQSTVAVAVNERSRASPCKKGTGDRGAVRGRPRTERPPAQILVVVASTPSRVGRTPTQWGRPLLCAVEDWSGAGFHTNSR